MIQSILKRLFSKKKGIETMKSVYRYRGMEGLIGQFQELENQEIFLCPPEYLNDPLEGFKNVVWEGTEENWKALFKHYIWCALCLAYKAGHPNCSELTCNDIPMMFHHEDAASTQYILYSKTFKKICDKFFSSDEKLVHFGIPVLARIKHINQSELFDIFLFVHRVALKHILFALKEDYGMTFFPTIWQYYMQPISHNVISLLENLKDADVNEINDPNHLAVRRKLTEIQRNHYGLKNDLLFIDLPPEYTFKYIDNDFTKDFIKQLQNLMFPNWYTACFSKRYDNPAMWGYYTNSHKGACLEFRVTDNKKISSLTYPLNPVLYNIPSTKINFFDGLGRITLPENEKFWHIKKQWDDGRKKKYWEDLIQSSCIKLEDWKHEQEYRMVHLGSMERESQVHKLSYDFDDLISITFGLNASLEDKKKVIDIIKKKCSDRQRKDFKFYGMVYNSHSHKIERFQHRI